MSCKIEIDIEDSLKLPKEEYLGPWRSWDIEFLQNPKAMDKTRRGLSDLEYNFNILLRVRRQREGAEDVLDKIDCKPNAINVVYTNNVTTEQNWIPMTPWIMAHRIGHTLISAPAVFKDPNYSTLDGPEAQLFVDLEDLYVDAFKGPMDAEHKMLTYDSRKTIAAYVRQHKEFTCMSGVGTYHVGFIATHLFTMKSARERMISNELDIFAEAFAQFLITGRFRMNRWAESGLAEMKNTAESKSHPCSQTKWGEYLKLALKLRISPEEFDAKVAAIEAEANRRMKELAGRLVGTTVAF